MQIRESNYDEEYNSLIIKELPEYVKRENQTESRFWIKKYVESAK